MEQKFVANLTKNLNTIFKNLPTLCDYTANEVDGKISIKCLNQEIGINSAIKEIKKAVRETMSDLNKIDAVITALNFIVEDMDYDVGSDGFGYDNDRVLALSGDDIIDFEEGLDFLVSEIPNVFLKS